MEDCFDRKGDHRGVDHELTGLKFFTGVPKL